MPVTPPPATLRGCRFDLAGSLTGDSLLPSHGVTLENLAIGEGPTPQVGNMAEEALNSAGKIGEGKLFRSLKKLEFEILRNQIMKITITIEDTDDGRFNVTETHVASDGETEESVTSATALADAMFEVMDQLGEVEGV